MKANCWNGVNDVRIESVPDPHILNPRDAIMRITSTAICGSDLHLYDGYIPTMMKGDILGHEFMGEVVEVGPGVTNLKVGDRVVNPVPDRVRQLLLLPVASMFSLCENSNPNAWMAEKLWGHSPAGLFGYSHLLGGYAGGPGGVRARAVRRRGSDQGARIAYATSRCCSSRTSFPPATWRRRTATSSRATPSRCGAAGRSDSFAIASAFSSARSASSRSIASRSGCARRGSTASAETLNYEEVDVLEALREMTGGRGPDACIDAVGTGSARARVIGAYDSVKQACACRPIGRRRCGRPSWLPQRRHGVRPRRVWRVPRQGSRWVRS